MPLDQVNIGFDADDAELSMDATEHLFLRSLRSRLTPIRRL
jgi:hypothetical protein